MAEVLASQRAMLERQGKVAAARCDHTLWISRVAHKVAQGNDPRRALRDAWSGRLKSLNGA